MLEALLDNIKKVLADRSSLGNFFRRSVGGAITTGPEMTVRFQQYYTTD